MSFEDKSKLKISYKAIKCNFILRKFLIPHTLPIYNYTSPIPNFIIIIFSLPLRQIFTMISEKITYSD